jgi:hypothetical protein
MLFFEDKTLGFLSYERFVLHHFPVKDHEDLVLTLPIMIDGFISILWYECGLQVHGT